MKGDCMHAWMNSGGDKMIIILLQTSVAIYSGAMHDVLKCTAACIHACIWGYL